jgi:hypothetical protein
MVAQWTLSIGSLALVLIATQPAKSLEWELIEDSHNKTSVSVPDNKSAHRQIAPRLEDRSKGGENEIKETIPTSNQDYGDSWSGVIPASASKEIIEPSEKLDTTMEPGWVEGNVRYDHINQSEKETELKSLEARKSQMNKEDVNRIQGEKPIKIHALTTQTNLLPVNNARPRNGIEWEIVSTEYVQTFPTAMKDRNPEKYITWVLVPYEEVITAEWIEEEINEQQEQLTKAMHKVNRTIAGNGRSKWLRRLFRNSQKDISMRVNAKEKTVQPLKIDYDLKRVVTTSSTYNAASSSRDDIQSSMNLPKTVKTMLPPQKDLTLAITNSESILDDQDKLIAEQKQDFVSLVVLNQSYGERSDTIAIEMQNSNWRSTNQVNAIPILRIKF